MAFTALSCDWHVCHARSYWLPCTWWHAAHHAWAFVAQSILPASDAWVIACFYPGRFGGAPMQCDLSVLVTMQAAFPSLSHARTSSWSIHKSTANNHRTASARRSRACLPCAWVDEYLLVPAWTLRPSLDTHSEGFLLCWYRYKNCFLLRQTYMLCAELVAGSASVSLT